MLTFTMLALSQDPEVAERQVEAVLYYLTTFGYVDKEFDLRERAFIRSFVRKLVTERIDAQGEEDAQVRFNLIESDHKRYVERFREIDQEIGVLFSETLSRDEDISAYVLNRLKIHCYELFEQFSTEERANLLDTADEFIRADGIVHPAEVNLREEIASYFGHEQNVELSAEQVTPITVDKLETVAHEPEDPPFFRNFEHHYAGELERLVGQIEIDMRALTEVEALWDAQRAKGDGRLAQKQSIAELEGEEFLDGHVHVVPCDPKRDFELIVLGDLHGCYSCLKAAIVQSKFMDKVRDYKANPEASADIRLVFLGDYIDRGVFGFNGILRAVLKLFATVPEHVVVLRGNHEYFVEHGGKIYGGVTPAESIASLSRFLPNETFHRYQRFFDAMPTSLLYDQLMFVHGGIPREATLRRQWHGLWSLNEADIRFEMLWSDPSPGAAIPDELQQATARFCFGRQQFREFMTKVGAKAMFRGHQKVNAGFKDHYPREPARLFTVFSAGGAENNDVPLESNYRDVRPTALTITRRAGEMKVTPWLIDYKPYQDPERNGFFRDDLVVPA